MFDRHLFITGMPGSGKSSLGRKVAGNLHVPFIDVDRRICDATGCTVAEIFERYGEQAFRNAETNMLIAISQEPPSIVSTGGGTVMRPENREIMRNFGLILLVDRPLEMILSDIKLDRRPLLAAKGLEEVERLYRERIDTYRAVADFSIVNDRDYFYGVDTMEKAIRQRFGL